MATYDLLVIDPQNDFMDIAGAALPVPGADADMSRLATWLDAHGDAVTSITITLDSHASVGVERTTFWQQADGTAVAPFTLVTAADVQAGKYLPRQPARLAETLAYLQALEAPGKRHLVVWPVHCVLGTWGHTIHQGLSDALARWEMRTGNICNKVLKGQNPMTEQYSAFRAEVPRADDGRTALNQHLLAQLATGADTLLVAGEASSHCVAASVEDMLGALPTGRLKQTVLLTDCMSPVTGFEGMADALFAHSLARGLRTMAIGQVPV
jgi:nicotinamidase-related amidase